MTAKDRIMIVNSLFIAKGMLNLYRMQMRQGVLNIYGLVHRVNMDKRTLNSIAAMAESDPDGVGAWEKYISDFREVIDEYDKLLVELMI